MPIAGREEDTTRLTFWRSGTERPSGRPPSTFDQPSGLPSTLATPISHRQFLKVVLGVAGGTGLALAGAARSALASYIPATPPGTMDTVDTNLTVQGNLIVTAGPNGPGNVGIGTANPQGKLDAAGTICVNGAVAIDSAGVAGQSYYAQ